MVEEQHDQRRLGIELNVLSKKTRGGLFIQFDIVSPSEEEIDKLSVDPPGAKYEKLLRMEEEMRRSGEIRKSPDTGFQERVETISDSSSCIGGYFEVRDEAAGDALIARLGEIFAGARLEVEYL